MAEENVVEENVEEENVEDENVDEEKVVDAEVGAFMGILIFGTLGEVFDIGSEKETLREGGGEAVTGATTRGWKIVSVPSLLL